jgi:hypothetical protein
MVTLLILLLAVHRHQQQLQDLKQNLERGLYRNTVSTRYVRAVDSLIERLTSPVWSFSRPFRLVFFPEISRPDRGPARQRQQSQPFSQVSCELQRPLTPINDKICDKLVRMPCHQDLCDMPENGEILLHGDFSKLNPSCFGTCNVQVLWLLGGL